MNNNFRFGTFGHENSTNNGLFYTDIGEMMRQRSMNPNISILISIEQDNQPEADVFWKKEEVLSALVAQMAKVTRIKINANQLAFSQFNELYPVTTIPSLFIFGPMASSPSLKYEGSFPNVEEFVARFNDIASTRPPVFQPPTFPTNNETEAAETQNNTQTSVPKTQSNESLPQQQNQQNVSHNPQITQSATTNQHQTHQQNPTNFQWEDEFDYRPRHRNAPKPKPVSAPKPKTPPQEFDIPVVLTTANGKVYSNTFKSTDNCLNVRVWVGSVVGKDHATLTILVTPKNFQLPISDKISLAQFKPKLMLQIPKVKTESIFSKFSKKFFALFEDFSIFADPNDNFADFWMKEPINRRNHRQQGQGQGVRHDVFNGNNVVFEPF